MNRFFHYFRSKPNQMRILILSLSAVLHTVCLCQDKPQTSYLNQPNILWLVCEDQSLFFTPYGDTNAFTPNINQLAENGEVYENCFAVSPVCSPSRSSIITGMYPTTIGTQNMRSYKKDTTSKSNHNNLPFYSPIPQKNTQFFPELLRHNGYYCTNRSKEDYNMIPSPLAWDESSPKAHWRNRKSNQPFFSIFNFNVTHESMIWKNHFKDSAKSSVFQLPELFPDENHIKNDFIVNYSNIEQLDLQVGEIIDQLKEDGLFDNTIIFFFSDHGGPFPRYKRSIYDTGIHCPLVIKWEHQTVGSRNDQLISFIDFAPTVLDALGINNKFYVEGLSFYKKDQRKYVFAASDRFDEFTDTRRCIRDRRYKLIINLDTLSAIGKPLSYRKQMKTMQVIDSLKKHEILKGYFNKWYQSGKEKYEFYDLSNDPLELENLFLDSLNKSKVKELKRELNSWMASSDYASLSERQMLNEMFPSDFSPKKLNPPIIERSDQGFVIHSNNGGASIGYRVKGDNSWTIIEEGKLMKIASGFEIILFKPGFEIFQQVVN